MKAWQDIRVLVVVYVLSAILATVPKYVLPIKTTSDGYRHSGYNNYIIFKNASLHLAGGQNLYQFWPEEQMDLYKYSPVFAAVTWPLSQLPDLMALFLWNGIGAIALLWAVRSLPLPPELTALMAWLVFVDHFTSMQNFQSNSLVAALMILVVTCWHRERFAAAGFAIGLSVFLKIFGAAAALLWFVYPHKIRSLMWCIIATCALCLLPLAITTFQNTQMQFTNWITLLRSEYAYSEGISVMGILHKWFGLSGHKSLTVLIGGLILVAPLLNLRRYADLQFRLGLLSSVMIWVVIFNHRAESPTFVIATSGVAIWFISRPRNYITIGLMALTVLISGFSSTDIVPRWAQDNLFDAYHLKAVPSLLVWLKIQAELWSPSPICGATENVVNETSPVSLPES